MIFCHLQLTLPGLLLTFWILPAISPDAKKEGACVLGVFEEKADSCVSSAYLKFGLAEKRETGASLSCCAARLFVTCILDKAEEQCGAPARSVARIMSTVAFNTAAQFSDTGRLDCDWNDSIYHDKSPICWPNWALGLGIGFLAALVLALVFVCVQKCCRTEERVCQMPSVQRTEEIDPELPTSTASLKTGVKNSHANPKVHLEISP